MPVTAKANFTAYGHMLSREEVHARLFAALEHRVLHAHNKELRGYFERVLEQIASPFAGSGEDDAISSSSDDDLEQTALLFCHHDADGDGVLSHDEFAAIVDLVAGQTGQTYTPEHVDHCFLQADVDGSGAIDLNELLLYKQKGAARHVAVQQRSPQRLALMAPERRRRRHVS